MICNNCGNNVPEGQYTCNVCGAFVGTQPAQPVQQNYQQMNYQQPQQGQYYGNTNTYQNLMNQPNTYDMKQYGPELGMKWYKFLIYFLLFFSAVLNVYSGYMAFTGKHYDMAAGYDGAHEIIYLNYEGLKVCDVIMALCCVGFAVFAIVVRFALAGYKQNGPKLLVWLYIATIIINILYALVVSSITAIAFFQLYKPTSMLGSLIMIYANTVYFRNRERMFVN